MADADELGMLRSTVEGAITAEIRAGADVWAVWDAVRSVGWESAFEPTVGARGAEEALAVAIACGRSLAPFPVGALVTGRAAVARDPSLSPPEGGNVLCGLDLPHDVWRGAPPATPADRLAVIPSLDVTTTIVTLAPEDRSPLRWRGSDLVSSARRLGALDASIPMWTVPLTDAIVALAVRDDAAPLPDGDRRFLVDVMLVVTAGEAVGLLQRALAATLEYASSRSAFGRPIGSFQAVKHMLADVKVDVESSLAVVTQAARQLDRGDDGAPFTVAAAVRHCCRRVLDALQLCVQVHGGIGVTMECELHLLIRRASMLRFLFADPFSTSRRVLTLYSACGPVYV